MQVEIPPTRASCSDLIPTVWGFLLVSGFLLVFRALMLLRLSRFSSWAVGAAAWSRSSPMHFRAASSSEDSFLGAHSRRVAARTRGRDGQAEVGTSRLKCFGTMGDRTLTAVASSL